MSNTMVVQSSDAAERAADEYLKRSQERPPVTDPVLAAFGIASADADAAAIALHGGLTHYPGRDGKAITWRSLPTDAERRAAADWWKKQHAGERDAAKQHNGIVAWAIDFQNRVADYADSIVETLAPLVERVEALERKIFVTDAPLFANLDLLKKVLEDFDQRMAEFDRRLTTLDARIERAAATNANAAAGDPTLAASTERRLSRNAEHIARLENRVKALETSGPR